ncbi:MAG: type II secretion system protein [Candidatus Daviesbacteria bacterium]|nr:type II secretion system protein [Candidatus Daviesbacteria bacterium]
MNDKSGFTLLEVLLAISVVAILSGLSIPVFRIMLTKNDLDIATTTVAQTLRRAQLLSQAVDGDTSWGLQVQSGSIVLFKGTSFISRDSNFDETFDMATTIGVSGTTEYVFSKFTGLPQATGTINLSTENDSRSVSINEKGTIGF